MTVWTEYQGVEVKDSDPKVPCRPPNGGYDAKKLGTLVDSTLLGLADGTFLVVCNDCGFNGLTGNEPYVRPEGEYKDIVHQADSVRAHKSSTHWRKAGRPQIYTEGQIKVVIKTWLKWKATRTRKWAQFAVDELDSLGFKPALSERWTAGALGTLVRKYMQKDPYKNIKAAAMDDNDREALAEMVREAAAYAAATRKTAVGANVRITTDKKPAHQHTPIDFKQIIEDKKTAQESEQQEDAEVATTKDNGATPAPTLNFVGSGGVMDPTPVRSMVVEETLLGKTMPAPAVTRSRAPHAVVAVPVDSPFELIIELPGGEPMFKYDGKLMVGKVVKGVDI
jgi:hypothetical protein